MRASFTSGSAPEAYYTWLALLLVNLQSVAVNVEPSETLTAPPYVVTSAPACDTQREKRSLMDAVAYRRQLMLDC
jgi:hypothetical protein